MKICQIGQFVKTNPIQTQKNQISHFFTFFLLFILNHPILRRFEAFSALPEIGHTVNFQAAKLLQAFEQSCKNFRVFRGQIRLFPRITIKPKQFHRRLRLRIAPPCGLIEFNIEYTTAQPNQFPGSIANSRFVRISL